MSSFGTGWCQEWFHFLFLKLPYRNKLFKIINVTFEWHILVSINGILRMNMSWLQWNSSILFGICGGGRAQTSGSMSRFSNTFGGSFDALGPTERQIVSSMFVSRGLLLVDCAQKTSVGRHANQMMEPPDVALSVSTVSPPEEQASLSGSAPQKKQIGCSFSQGPQLVTFGGIKIRAWPVNQASCLSGCLLLSHDGPKVTSLLMPHPSTWGSRESRGSRWMGQSRVGQSLVTNTRRILTLGQETSPDSILFWLRTMVWDLGAWILIPSSSQ